MPARLALHTPILPMGLPAIGMEQRLECSQSRDSPSVTNASVANRKNEGQASPIPRHQTQLI